MKNIIHILAALLFTINVNAQNVFNVTENTVINAGEYPDQHSNLIVNISEGVTLTLNMDVYLQNTTFNGGNIVVNKALTFWSAGNFNNTKVTFKQNSKLVTSGVLTFKNTEVTFTKNSTATIWTSLEMNNSRIKLLDNSNLEATSGNFNLRNTSAIIVGDGTTVSNSFIKFNGATLNEYDNSYVTMGNYNNYYFNWSNYNARSINKSIATQNNALNCNTQGKNACYSPNVYGPATLNFAGITSSATLPVKLSAFGVKSVNSVSELTWKTDAEINAERFDVERSADGQNWVVTGSVKANVNTSQVSSYDFNDVLKVGGKYYYRLKMIDLDGSFEYSPVRAINAEGTVEMNVYPNPATNYLVVNTKNAAEKLTIQLITLSGQMIKQVNGNGNTVVPVSELKTGNYVVRVIKADNQSQSFRIQVKK